MLHPGPEQWQCSVALGTQEGGQYCPHVEFAIALQDMGGSGSLWDPGRSLPPDSALTEHVHIPGLLLLPDFITAQEEEELLEVLHFSPFFWGPSLPLTSVDVRPTQHINSMPWWEGGKIKRRVQVCMLVEGVGWAS